MKAGNPTNQEFVTPLHMILLSGLANKALVLYLYLTQKVLNKK